MVKLDILLRLKNKHLISHYLYEMLLGKENYNFSRRGYTVNNQSKLGGNKIDDSTINQNNWQGPQKILDISNPTIKS